MKRLKQFAKFLDGEIFPRSFTCDICGIETFGTNLCPQCRKTVTFNDRATCPVCGRKTFRPEICMECKAQPPLFKKAVSPIVYDGGATKLMAKFKNGNGYLKEYFADIMRDKLIGFPEADCIVAVPMTKKAADARGYNQSYLLAKSLSARVNRPFLKDVIEKVKPTHPQKTLGRKERAQNLETCFKVRDRKSIKNKNVLIVDDVMTTGATADALTKKLLGAGAAKVYVVTVMSVEYKQFKDKARKF